VSTSCLGTRLLACSFYPEKTVGKKISDFLLNRLRKSAPEVCPSAPDFPCLLPRQNQVQPLEGKAIFFIPETIIPAGSSAYEVAESLYEKLIVPISNVDGTRQTTMGDFQS